MDVKVFNNATPIISLPSLHFPVHSQRRHTLGLGPRDSISFSNSSSLVSTLKIQPIRQRCLVVASVLKKVKERKFDAVIEKKKKLRIVTKIKNILLKYPDRVMPLKELGEYKKDIKIPPRQKLITFIKRFPAVFELVEAGSLLCFRLTPEADKLVTEEEQLRGELEGILVTKLRKLLMMSLEKRISLERIGHLRTDLCLPEDFRTNLCLKYPEYFKVVESNDGPALELTSWDPALAVSAAEATAEAAREREMAERNLIIDRPPKFNKPYLPKGIKLKRTELKKLSAYMNVPYVSPYSDFRDIKPGSLEKEKHSCGVVHELLSLTVEKRTLIDHLTHFRDHYRFSQRIRSMLLRHPEMFYVSFKGMRDSVFLREAYHDSELVEKDPIILCQEKLLALVTINRYKMRRKVVGVLGEESDDEMHLTQAQLDEDGYNEELSDGDVSDWLGDVDGDEWSDVDDDDVKIEASVPKPEPLSKLEILKRAAKKSEFKRIPVIETELTRVATPFRDDKPRERW